MAATAHSFSCAAPQGNPVTKPSLPQRGKQDGDHAGKMQREDGETPKISPEPATFAQGFSKKWCAKGQAQDF